MLVVGGGVSGPLVVEAVIGCIVLTLVSVADDYRLGAVVGSGVGGVMSVNLGPQAEGA